MIDHTTAPLLRDTWYVAAWSHEIGAEALFARTVAGEPLLLYRLAGGEVVALEDRCVHRQAPLSRGRREGDAIRCGYHGLLFDARGRCTEVPGLGRPPDQACVRRYPVVERRRWVFVWLGDPALADPALLPDNLSNDHPDGATCPATCTTRRPGC